jgi:hypothetical protein
VQNRNDSTEGTCGQQNQVQHGEHSSQSAQHLIDRSLLLFAALVNNHRNENGKSSGKNMHQGTN